MAPRRKREESGPERKFLLVIDETVECDRAVYYAARRAARTAGKLVMLAVVPVAESNQQWLGVGELMRAEGRETRPNNRPVATANPSTPSSASKEAIRFAARPAGDILP